MGTNYTGRDPFTWLAQPLTYGYWVDGLAVDDGDLDDAAHLNALVMAAMDRTNFLAWRTMDIVHGGVYSFTTNIATANGWFYNGFVSIRAGAKVSNNSTLYIGDPAITDGAGHVVVFGGDITLDSSTSIEVQGDAAINLNGTSGHPGKLEAKNHSLVQIDSGAALTTISGATVTRGANETRTGSETLSGNGAFTAKRIVAISGSGSPTIDASTGDIFVLANSISASPQNITFSNNSSAAGHVWTVVQSFSNPGNAVLIFDGSSVKLADFASVDTTAAPQTGSVTFYYNASGVAKVLSVWQGNAGTVLAQQF